MALRDPDECDHAGDWEDWGDAFVCEQCRKVMEKDPEIFEEPSHD